MTSIGDLGSILTVWAHPDDETWLAAGVIATAREQGQRVVCASATAGEHGTADPESWPPERLGRIRRWEAAAAMAVLGVEEHEVHDLPDGGLDRHEETGLAWAARLVATVAPDTIITFGSDGMTHHPDHIAVHRWVTRAWHDAGRPGGLLYATATEEELARFGPLYEEWDMYMSDERPLGVPRDGLALHVELDDVLVDRKVAALRAMASQTADLVAALDERVLRAMVCEEAFVEATIRSVP